MKISNKLYDYEVKAKEIENTLINEKINYTTKKYFFIINNYSKEISKIEEEINILHPRNPININELIYNQHFIIKELISIINKKEMNNTDVFQHIKEYNNIQKHIISFNILTPNKNNKNSHFRAIEPSPVYRKKLTINTNSSNKINTSYSKNDDSNSLEKRIINSLSTYENNLTLKSHNKMNKSSNIIPSRETYESLKYKLKYKYYKPSFLNSFVSGKKNKNKNKLYKAIRNNSELLSTNLYSYEKKKKNNKNVSYFNGIHSVDSKKDGIKRVKSIDNKNYKVYDLKILDDCIVNNFLDRTNSTSKPKANKYVKNLYFISNEKVDKYQKKIVEE